MERYERNQLQNLLTAFNMSYGLLSHNNNFIGYKEKRTRYYAALRVDFEGYSFTMYTNEHRDYVGTMNGVLKRYSITLQTRENGYNQLLMVINGMIKGNIQVDI